MHRRDAGEKVVTVPTFGPVSKSQVHMHGVGGLVWCKYFYGPAPRIAYGFQAVAECWEDLAFIAEAVAWTSLYYTQLDYYQDLATVLLRLKEGPKPSLPAADQVAKIVGREVSDALFAKVPSLQAKIISAIGDLFVEEGDPTSATLNDLGRELADRYGPRLISETTTEVMVKYIQGDVFKLVSFPSLSN